MSLPEDWDRFDTIALSTLAVESIYDIMTTSYRLKHPREGLRPGQYFEEVDPILGKNPDSFRLWTTGILFNSLMLVTCMFLPKWPRQILEGVVVGFETGNLIGNAGSPGYVAYHMAF
jgi:hypothetical protein